MNTNWSKPKTNFFAGINELRKALAAGMNARLIRMQNKDCEFPIKVKNEDEDFKNYKFNVGYLSTITDIVKNINMTEFQKYLTLNYKSCYGTPEAVERYYEKSLLSIDNFNNMGVAHLVKVEDMVHFYMNLGNQDLADIYKNQYIIPDNPNKKHFFEFFCLKKEKSQWNIKSFKRKLWVIEIIKTNDDANDVKISIPISVKILNVLLYPFKYIPKRNVMNMDKYKLIEYSIGNSINGYHIEFQIPKKFSFK